MVRSCFVLLSVVAVSLSSDALAEVPQPVTRNAASEFQLVSAEKAKLLRKCLPAVADPEMQEILDDPGLMFYTDAEMPRAYQVWDGQLQGLHSPNYNISANNSEPYGNGNIEFPWGTPAGTHRTSSVSTFRFLWLPRDDHGRRRPVVWFQKYLRGDSSPGYAWRYPVGARVGEVLMLRAPNGYDYTFELRVRTREYADWAVDVFRPFPTAKHLADAIRQRRKDWESNQQLSKLVHHLESNTVMPERYLADNHGRAVIQQTQGVDVLPAVSDQKLVVQLLTKTTFKSCLGEVWRQGEDDVLAYAPTTTSELHVVPANYDGGFIEVDRDSCMRCHQTVNQHVATFDYGRDWYGRIRGSDGIFSFHPFDPSSISYNGFGVAIRMHPTLTNAGVIARYNPEVHPESVYHDVPALLE
jgi:hypothetical protein